MSKTQTNSPMRHLRNSTGPAISTASRLLKAPANAAAMNFSSAQRKASGCEKQNSPIHADVRVRRIIGFVRDGWNREVYSDADTHALAVHRRWQCSRS